MDLHQFISKFRIQDLRRFLGEDLVAAVNNGVYDTGVSQDLATLLMSKLGTRILEDADIRKCIIDDLSVEIRTEIQSRSKLSDNEFQTLQSYFGGVWSVGKSTEFVNALGLDPKYIKKVTEETRQHSELIAPKFGETARLNGFLHYYQKDIKDKINTELRYPDDRLMVQMPTGSGKTYTALETFVDLLRTPTDKGSRCCVWLVNSPEFTWVP